MKNHTAYWQSSFAFAINLFAGFGFFIAFLVQYFDKGIVIYDLLFYALILWAISAAFLVVTSYSYPGSSAEKNSTPSYRSTEPSQPMYSQAQKATSCERQVPASADDEEPRRSEPPVYHEYKKCPSCGAMVIAGEPCPLCGAQVE